MQGEVLHITAYQGNDYPCVNISQYGVPGQQQGRSIDILEITGLNQAPFDDDIFENSFCVPVMP